MAGPFANPNYSSTPPPGERYWGGIPSDFPPGGQLGHGHQEPGMTPRMPVADFLGNIAAQGADVRIQGQQRPRW